MPLSDENDATLEPASDAGQNPAAGASEAQPDPTPVPQPAPEPIHAPKPEPVVALAVVPTPVPFQSVPPPAAKSGFWVRPGWLALVLAILFSVILSTTASLGTLYAQNKGLRYASPSEVQALQAKVDALQTRLAAQEKDLAGMRARLDAVEKLAGRTSTLEQAAADLRAQLEKRGVDLDTLKGVVSDAQKQIEQVITRSSAFETFINGMRSLLDKIPLPGVTKP